MSQSNPHLVFLVNSLSIFLMSIAVELNFDDLYIFLTTKDYHQSQIEHIELLKMLGQMIASFALMQIINLINSKKLFVIFLSMLLISKFSIMFLADYNLVKIHYIIASGCCFNLFVLFLLQIHKCLNNHLHTITIFLLLIILGRITGEAIFNYVINFKLVNCELLTMLIYIFILLVILFFKTQISINTLFKMDFIDVVKNIELELIAAFTVAYVVMAFYWEYEIFAIAENLKIGNIIEVKYYLLLSCLVISCPMHFIFKPRRVINIILLILLLLNIFGLKYVDNNYNLNLSIIVVIGIALGYIWINNLITMFKKFSGENLNIAVTCYFCFLSIGGYLGMISTDEAINKIGEWGFIYSICFVVGAFLLYYAGKFSQNKY